MTSWTPKIARHRQSQGIVEALASDIASGALRPGQQLPTHRDLAFRLGVAVATVTKAYGEAKRRGYVRGGVGSGTFVLEPPLSERRRIRPDEAVNDAIDLSFNTAITSLGQTQALTAALARLGAGGSTGLLEYHRPWAGQARHRAAGSTWLASLGLATRPEDVVVTCGAQHAASIVLLSNAAAGDVLLSDALTDPLIKLLATTLQLELRGVPGDDEGLCPKALEAACRGGRVRALLCMPDHHSPTLLVMPEKRRRALASVARAHDLVICENAVYRPLVADPPPPISAFAPERSFFFSSLSKIIAPGLRLGFLAAPEARARDLILGLGGTCWMAPPLTAEIACGWIEDGTATRLAERQRHELQLRNALAARHLGRFRPAALTSGMHLWLSLPASWRAGAFVREVAARGTLVMPSEAFAVGRAGVPHAVRVSLGGAVESRERLETGLSTLAAVLAENSETAYVPI